MTRGDEIYIIAILTAIGEIMQRPPPILDPILEKAKLAIENKTIGP